VIGLDANVVVRLLLGDDPDQTRRAEEAFLEHARGDGVYVTLVVLAEVAWVLQAGYRLPRETVHERLGSFVRTRGVFVEQVDVVLDALDRYRAGDADFADLLILGASRLAGAAPLLTFDRRLARLAGVEEL